MDEGERAERIRRLNEEFRTTMRGGRVVVTAGVQALGALGDIVETVRRFNEFTPDNDPYGERDFGSFAYRGEQLFWKIDYYDPDLRSGSEDPADPNKTTRVLTIALMSEY